MPVSEEMQQVAVDTAIAALAKYEHEKDHEKDAAMYIKKEFDRLYNTTWHCVVGKKYVLRQSGPSMLLLSWTAARLSLAIGPADRSHRSVSAGQIQELYHLLHAFGVTKLTLLQLWKLCHSRSVASEETGECDSGAARQLLSSPLLPSQGRITDLYAETKNFIYFYLGPTVAILLWKTS